MFTGEPGAQAPSRLRPRATPGVAVPAGPAALPALTSLRFFAALVVVCSHFAQIGLLAVPQAVQRAVDGGRPAVSFFFVLSGFILTWNYRRPLATGGAPARRTFYSARFARIYPVLVLSLVLALPVTAWLLHDGDAALLREWYGLSGSDGANLRALCASLVLQLLALTAWTPFAALNQPWNGPAWSISCEAFFYALFPWLLARLGACGNRGLAAWCVALWLAQGAWIAWLQHALPVSRHGFLVAQFPPTHLFEFVLGICAALVHARHAAAGAVRVRVGHVLAVIALAGIVALSVLQPLAPAFYMQSPLFGALIVGMALSGGPAFLSWRWLVTLGEASFALYLLHVPLGRLLRLADVPAAAGWPALAAVVGISVLVFRGYEEPLRRRLRRRLAPATPSLAVVAHG
ncbi:acyltransferase [Cupriavidus sp. WKF15]|uniref:acyltransferase family protein n=1 Tax=Cupriavidus sp. WKF15 TaxID=3032282 RepID=UPI0023E181B6|nr:acyltransferase [Cupriavidus sp. WKF15]WER48968.1 acyltransferase [Cupriavidus sp. WKF15]